MPPFCSQNVEPAGRRFIVAVDVSTSLSSVVPGTPVSTAVAAAAIAMVRRRPVPGWLGRLWLWVPVSSFPPRHSCVQPPGPSGHSRRDDSSNAGYHTWGSLFLLVDFCEDRGGHGGAGLLRRGRGSLLHQGRHDSCRSDIGTGQSR